ncbi:MAG: hypothetical protein JW889_16235 [Verrucomicrobia bacterium]|nr:hypothetical protein [Verrucomicrobiota bacterium]
MKRLILIAVAALTMTAWVGSAFAHGRVYRYTSGGWRYSDGRGRAYHRVSYAPRRTYYRTYRYYDAPRYYYYHQPSYRRVYYYPPYTYYGAYYYVPPVRVHYYRY